MAKYTYDGQSYTVDDDVPQDQAIQMIKAHASGPSSSSTVKESSPLDYGPKQGLGALEAIGSVLAPLPSTITGGLAGLGELMTGGGLDRANEVLQAHQKSNFGLGAYQPATERGQTYGKNLAHGFEKVAETAGDVGAFIAPKSLENAARTAGEVAANTAMMFLPLPVGKAVKALPKGSKSKGAIDRYAEPTTGETSPPSSDTAFWKQRAEQIQAEKQAAQVAEGQQPIYVDKYGNATNGPYSDIRQQSVERLPQSVRDQQAIYNREGTVPPQPWDGVERRGQSDFLMDENQKALPFEESSPESIKQNWQQKETQGDLFAGEGGQSVPSRQLSDFGTQDRTGYSVPQELNFGAKPDRPNVLETAKTSLESAQEKMANGRGFDMTPEEKIAWDKNRTIPLVDEQGKPLINGPMPFERKQPSANPWDDVDERALRNTARQNSVFNGDVNNIPPAIRKVQENPNPSVKEQQIEQAYQAREAAKQEAFEQAKQDSRQQAADQLQTTATTTKRTQFVPRSQRGALNFDDVSKAVKAAGTALSKMLDPTQIPGVDRPSIIPSKVEALGKVPGIAKATKDWIPDNVPVAETKAKAMNEGPEQGALRAKWLRDGGVSVGEQRKSAIIQDGVTTVLNGVKRAERSIRSFVEPFERSLFWLKSPEVLKLADIERQASLQGIEHTPESLRQLGLSEKAIKAFEARNKMMDEALKVQNETLGLLNKKPITKAAAYLSSRWQGPFKIPVYVKGTTTVGGKPTSTIKWYIAEHTSWAAERALKNLIDNGVPVDMEKTPSKPEFRNNNSTNPYAKKSAERNRGVFDDAYGAMLAMLDQSDPLVAHIKKVAEDYIQEQSYGELGQYKHFEPKHNIRGFQGDRPWNDVKKEAYSLYKAQVQYAKNAFQWAEDQKSVTNIKQLLADPELQKLQPSNLQFLRDYTRNHLGYGTAEVVKSVETYLEQKSGVSKGIITEYTNIAKGIFLSKQLSFNLGFVGMQLMQPLNSIPYHMKLFSEGYHSNPITVSAKTLNDYLGHAANGIFDPVTGERIHYPVTEFGKQAWEYAEQNGVGSRNIFDENAGMGEHKGFEMAKQVVDFLPTATEKIIRPLTFMTFAHALKESGKFTDMKLLFQKAENMTNQSLVAFDRSERAMVFSKLGVVGNGLSTLKSYPVNWFNTLGKTFNMAYRDKKILPLATLLFVQGYLWGAKNLPFVEEMDSMWEGFKSILPNESYDKVKDWSIKEAILKNTGKLAYGSVSKMTGMDWTTRSSLALDQNASLDGLFPFVSDIWNMASTGAKALSPGANTTDEAQAAYTMAPSGWMKGRVSQSKEFQSGKNADGTTNFVKPSKLKEHQFDYARTQKESNIKRLGFTPLDEAMTKDMTYSQQNRSKQYKDRRQQAVDAAFDAMVRGKPEEVAKHADLYLNSFEGDPNAYLNDIIYKAESAVKDQATLSILHSNSLTAIQKYKRLQDSLKQMRSHDN